MNSTWGLVCAHCNGLALGPVLESFSRRKVLDRLLRCRTTTVGELGAATGARLGPLHAALRSLASLGWLDRLGRAGDPQMRVSLTKEGQTVGQVVEVFQLVSELFQTWDGAPLEPWVSLSHEGWGLPKCSVGQRLAAFLDGFLVAPQMVRNAGLSFGPLETVFRRMGWIDEGKQPTTAGTKALKLTLPYRLPWSYRHLLKGMDGELFGAGGLVGSDSEGAEAHLDRQDDISFSGELAESMCLDVALPGLMRLFSQRPLNQQPSFVADTGAGDGRLLASLGRLILEETERGRHLHQAPLTLLALDASPVSRAQCRRTLSKLSLPFFVAAGDIGRPDLIAQEVRGFGLDPCDGLHLSKSVFHDRTYHPPKEAVENLPESDGAFLDLQDRPLDNRLLGQNLVETFRAWTPYLKHHPLLVYEAHTASTQVLAAHRDRNWSPCFDLLQSLSRQYPVETEVFFAAAEAAGLKIQETLDPTQGAFGFQSMSMSWLELARD